MVHKATHHNWRAHTAHRPPLRFGWCVCVLLRFVKVVVVVVVVVCACVRVNVYIMYNGTTSKQRRHRAAHILW